MSASTMKMTLSTTDGKSYDINAVFADLIRFDILRSRNNLPAREGNEFVFMGVVAFCSLVRTGQLEAGTNLDTFLNTIETIEPVEDVEGAEFPEPTTTTD